MSASVPMVDTYYFAKLTETDHAGVLWVITILSLTYILVSCSFRLWTRYGMYGPDDWTLLACVMMGVFQHIAVFFALHYGLGKASTLLQEGQIEKLSHSLYAATMLFVVTHCLAKVSIALFIRRLFSTRALLNRTICNSLVVISIAWGVCSMIVLRMECFPSFLYADHNTCPGRQHRWVTVGALDIATDVALVVVPAMLVFRVLTNQGRKAIVLSAFVVRLPLIAFCVVHLLPPRRVNSLTLAGPLAWLQAELLWSVVTASMPPLKHLFRTHDHVSVLPLAHAANKNTKASSSANMLLMTPRPGTPMLLPLAKPKPVQCHPTAKAVPRRGAHLPHRPRPFSGAHATPQAWRTAADHPAELELMREATRPVSVVVVSSAGVTTTQGVERDLELGVRMQVEWEVRHEPLDLGGDFARGLRIDTACFSSRESRCASFAEIVEE
ncbi:hypothetical protein MBLNU459_g1920t1 [Dothideomycetes sp. NU459]